MGRPAHEVFEDHLELLRAGDLETDLRRNYADDVVLLTGAGIFHGHDGVRHCARLLHRQLPKASYTFRTRMVSGEVAFLEWTAEAPGVAAQNGADTYLIHHGHIAVQTIHSDLSGPASRHHGG